MDTPRTPKVFQFFAFDTRPGPGLRPGLSLRPLIMCWEEGQSATPTSGGCIFLSRFRCM
jgi:hypothetical protein